MSDLLGDLVGRSLGVVPVVRPRLPSVFERPGRELDPDAPAPAASPSPERRLIVSAPASPASQARPAVAPEATPRAHERAVSAPVGRAVESRAVETPQPPLRTGTPAPSPTPASSHGEAAAIEHRLVVERPAPAPHAPATPAERSSVTEAVSPPVRTVETRTVDRLRIERGAERPSPPSRAVSAAGLPGAAPRTPEPEQVVHVHIGRIEVRAPAPPKPPRRAPSLREPTLSLAAYLGDAAKGTR